MGVFEEHFLETNELEENVSSDFIPLDPVKTKSKRSSRAIKVDGFSDLKVEVIASKKPKVFAAESVLNFRETMLYGAGSKVKRESSKTSIAKNENVREKCYVYKVKHKVNHRCEYITLCL